MGFDIPEALTKAPDDKRRRDGVPLLKLCALCKREKPGYIVWTGQYVCAEDIKDTIRLRPYRREARHVFHGESLDQPERETMTDRPRFDSEFWGKYL